MTRLPWWQTDTYDDDTPFPLHLAVNAGPKGLAVVRAWPNGSTDKGWGLRKPEQAENEGFMWRYNRRKFEEGPVVWGLQKGMWYAALVMRSVRMVCIDIDGKNGGFDHAGKLGMLPLTLAEKSKSGNGYHLFYLTSDDEWDSERGFDIYSDKISFEQGVDIRATGCVYHHPAQRWNRRHPVELPRHLKDRLHHAQVRVLERHTTIIKTLESEDPTEVLLMHDALITDLKKPIPAGRRNNTLFALGCQMKIAHVPDWQTLINDRALAVGLSISEAEKLVANIERQP